MHSDTKYKLREIKEFTSLLHGRKILDIGSGEGHDANYLEKCGLDITAIDLSKEMIERSRRTYPDVKFKHVSLMEHEGEYDGIWSDSCFPYLNKEEVLSALMHMRKMLKREGVAMISFYTGRKNTIFHSENENKIEKLMEQASLQIISSKKKRDWIYMYLKRNGN